MRSNQSLCEDVRSFLVLFSIFLFAPPLWANESTFCNYLTQSKKMDDKRVKILQKVEVALERPVTPKETKRTIIIIEKELRAFNNLKNDFEKVMQPFIDGEFSTLTNLQMKQYESNLEYINLTLETLKKNDAESYFAYPEQVSINRENYDRIIFEGEKETDRLYTKYPYPCGVRVSNADFIRVIGPGILVLGSIIWWGFLKERF